MTPFVSPVGAITLARGRMPRVLSTIGKVLYAGSGLGTAAMFLARGDHAFGPIWVVALALSSLSSIASILWLVSYVLGLAPSAFSAPIAVDGATLRVGHVVVPLERITGALVVERTALGITQPCVEIELDGGDRLTARFADPIMARSIVDALGFGPRGRRVRTHVALPTRRLLHLLYGMLGSVAGSLVMGLVGAGARGPSVLGAIAVAFSSTLALGVYGLVKRLLGAPTITVGDDEVRVERAFRARRLSLRNVAAEMGTFVFVDQERLRALVSLAQERAGTMVTSAERRAAFVRGGQPLEAWRVRVAQTIGNTSYRGATVTADDARATLTSADASVEERVGAALALRATGEPPERIRVAAEAFADPRLRVAIEAVADGDDARADEALRKMA